MNGKGDKRRPEDYKKYKKGYEKAFGGSETLKGIKSLKREWKMNILGEK